MRLEKLIEKINQISSKNTISEIADLTVDHLLYFFKFDFCVISFIDYISDRIESRFIESKKYYSIEKLNEWKNLSSHKLNSSDILVKVLSAKEIIRVKGCNIDGIEYKIGEKGCPLNRNIYDKFEHKYLNRLFLALVNRTDIYNTKGNDKILGIIETGFIDKKLQKKIPVYKINQLKIYVDNIAQTINDALEKEYKDKFLNLIEKHADIFEPNDYRKILFNELVKFTKSSAAELIDLKYENYTEYDRKLIYDPKKNLNENPNITKFFDFNGDNNQTKILINTDFESLCSNRIKVVLFIPLQYFGSLTGLIILYFYRINRFIEVKANYFKVFVDLITLNYQKKLVNKSVSQIGLTLPISINIKEKYNNIIKTLRDYFISDNVIIWQIIYNGSNEHLKSKYIASESLEENYQKIGIASIEPETNNRDKKYRKYDLVSTNIDIDDKILKFCDSHKFKTYITIPISYQKQIYGYIDIFLKRVIPILDTEDEIFLTQLANKLGVSIQLGQLMNSFSEISNSLFREDLSNILNEITKKAKELLDANPVILFVCDNNNELKFSDAYYAGTFYEEKIQELIFKNQQKAVDLAGIILKKGTVWIEDKKEYDNFKKTVTRNWDSSIFTSEFWSREQIKSFAAIRLRYSDDTLGVMFVNYREQKKFTHDLRDLINAFASLISVAIINAKFLLKTTEQKEKLLELAEITNPGSIAIGYIHDAKHSMQDINALISSLIYFIPKSRQESQEVKPIIDSLITNTNHLSSLFSSLVKIAHEKKPIFNNERVKDILDELNSSFETRLKKNNVKLNIKLSNKSLMLKCDRNKILQVFINLFSNSFYSLSKKTHVTKEISIVVSEDIVENRIKIVFKDNGLGISEGNKKKVFIKSFSTKKGEGSGFGLLVIKRIIDTHGGKIKVYSEYGISATFIIFLPNKN